MLFLTSDFLFSLTGGMQNESSILDFSFDWNDILQMF